MNVCFSLTCTFIGIIIAVVVFSVVLILFALFRHFYSWTALRELHKGIESSVLGTNYTGSGLPNFAARDHSDYKQTHTKAHYTHTVLMKCTHTRLRVMAFYWQHFIRNAWVARKFCFFAIALFMQRADWWLRHTAIKQGRRELVYATRTTTTATTGSSASMPID